MNEQEVSNVYAHFSTAYSSMIISKHTIFVTQASPKRSSTTKNVYLSKFLLYCFPKMKTKKTLSSEKTHILR